MPGLNNERINGYPVPDGFKVMAGAAAVVDHAEVAGVPQAEVQRALWGAAALASGSRIDTSFPAQSAPLRRLSALTRGEVARRAVAGRARGARFVGAG